MKIDHTATVALAALIVGAVAVSVYVSAHTPETAPATAPWRASARPYTPASHLELDRFEDATTQCSGLAQIGRTPVYVLDAVNVPVRDGRDATALYDTETRAIYVTASHLHDPPIMRHEMLHARLWTRLHVIAHDPKYFPRANTSTHIVPSIAEQMASGNAKCGLVVNAGSPGDP